MKDFFKEFDLVSLNSSVSSTNKVDFESSGTLSSADTTDHACGRGGCGHSSGLLID